MVLTLSRKSRSCETTTRATSFNSSETKYFSNQRIACQSKWFVGSSKSRTLGLASSALANATRMRHPPLRSRVGFRRSISSKPKPFKITSACPFMESAPRICSRSRTSAKICTTLACTACTSAVPSACTSDSKASAAFFSCASASSRASRAALPRRPLSLLSYMAALKRLRLDKRCSCFLKAFTASTADPLCTSARELSSSKSSWSSL
mmetsp:Transcript_77288/g.121678  ORF Transcript_77288/g.121678 Transcript_77288/m.121678 type:complete len:208 (+) Transcript_77288:1201-1824(+)